MDSLRTEKVKICTKCKLKFPDTARSCSNCYGELVDRKTLVSNARITVTVTKPVYAALAQEAENQSMVLSEYAASLLRQKAMILKVVQTTPAEGASRKKAQSPGGS